MSATNMRTQAALLVHEHLEQLYSVVARLEELLERDCNGGVDMPDHAPVSAWRLSQVLEAMLGDTSTLGSVKAFLAVSDDDMDAALRGERGVPAQGPDDDAPSVGGAESRPAPAPAEESDPAERAAALAELKRACSIVNLTHCYLNGWTEATPNDGLVAGAVQTASALLAEAADRLDGSAGQGLPLVGGFPILEALRSVAGVLDKAEQCIQQFEASQDAAEVADSLGTISPVLEAAAKVLEVADQPEPGPKVDPEAEAALRVAAMPSGAQAAFALMRAVAAVDDASYEVRQTSDLAAGASVIEASLHANVAAQTDPEHRRTFLLALSHYITTMNMHGWVPELEDRPPYVEPVASAPAG